jgi:hypothetical protein
LLSDSTTRTPDKENPVKLTTHESMDQTLSRAKDEKAAITVCLRGGTTFTGKVGDVGDHWVVVAELEGREYYDALVKIEEITALQVRARESLS